MSSHRAERRRVTPDAASRSAQPESGRRRAERAPRRGSGLSASSMIGGAALLVAAVGAATAGQAMSSPSPSAASADRSQGGYVANLSAASLEGRDATQVSRSGGRPELSSVASDRQKAEKQAAKRTEQLRNAAAEAEDYADELSSDTWVFPTSSFNISTWFGEAGPYWSSGYHTGIDFAAPYGTPVISVSNAVVTQTGWDGAYGNQVRAVLENGDEVWYNHMSSIEVTVGETLLKGQELGRVGDTGNAYGFHLHFEYRLASDLTEGVDPRPYFAEHALPLN